jgi:uncharacterized protein YjiS (DUF1127 family)
MRPEEKDMTSNAISGRQPALHAGYARLEIVAETALAALRALWKGWLSIHAAWNAERARNELRALSDRTLKDIGLHRSQIDSLYR